MAGKKKPGPAKSPIGRRVRTMLDARCIEEAEGIIDAVISAAKCGDISAAQTLLNRIYPPRRGCLITFEQFPVNDAKDIRLAYDHYERLAADGKISTDELGQLTALVERKAKAFELIEQERRIQELEDQISELKAGLMPRVA
ncbi:hypothetical protein [Ruegeria sp. 6PALISEP08]|uniref:hypothetical protein n=1 Tax=Ruegeria sp. 6PALISEP08 TaxID=1225660 RepID=UPI000A9C5C06|nr:hypothetical protein [Ruegeria sp. 6PALISEP08]